MINQTTNITVPSSLWQANYEGDVEPSVEVLVDTADGLQKMLPQGVTINSGLVSVNFSSPQTGKLILVKADTQTFVGAVVRLGGDAVIGSNTTSTTPGTSGPWAGIPVFGPWTWREGNPVPTSGEPPLQTLTEFAFVPTAAASVPDAGLVMEDSVWYNPSNILVDDSTFTLCNTMSTWAFVTDSHESLHLNNFEWVAEPAYPEIDDDAIITEFTVTLTGYAGPGEPAIAEGSGPTAIADAHFGQIQLLKNGVLIGNNVASQYAGVTPVIQNGFVYPDSSITSQYSGALPSTETEFQFTFNSSNMGEPITGSDLKSGALGVAVKIVGNPERAYKAVKLRYASAVVKT